MHVFELSHEAEGFRIQRGMRSHSQFVTLQIPNMASATICKTCRNLGATKQPFFSQTMSDVQGGGVLAIENLFAIQLATSTETTVAIPSITKMCSFTPNL